MQFLVKTMENVRNHGDIELVTTAVKRDSLVSEPKYYRTNFSQKTYWEQK